LVLAPRRVMPRPSRLRSVVSGPGARSSLLKPKWAPDRVRA
jgi:hypothetical protein